MRDEGIKASNNSCAGWDTVHAGGLKKSPIYDSRSGVLISARIRSTKRRKTWHFIPQTTDDTKILDGKRENESIKLILRTFSFGTLRFYLTWIFLKYKFINTGGTLSLFSLKNSLLPYHLWVICYSNNYYRTWYSTCICVSSFTAWNCALVHLLALIKNIKTCIHRWKRFHTKA